jgi:membrane-bound lytic murein transglycosylase D
MKHSWFTLTLQYLAISLFCFLQSSGSIASPSPEGIQVYQKNMHLSPEHKQRLAADIDLYNNADNIWDTMRHEFTLPHYEDSARVQQQIEWFMNNQDFLYRSAARAAPYLYYILQQVRMRHLPVEVALIPIIESSFNPFALSSAGAAGIWQMMPGTASGYGIRQNWWYDGRRDVVASTKAALNYLAYLDNFFDGNWLYAVAAYDTGEGNIQAAIKRNVRDGITTDYWSLPVAQETRDYIPKLLALAIIISNPDRYPVELPYLRNAPYLAQVDIGAQIDLNHAASLAGLSLKELKQLNPGYNRSATDPNGPFKLVLPIENVEEFTENLSTSPLYHRINWINYKWKSSDTLASVAKRFNTTTGMLRKINPTLASNLKPGVSIIIPRTIPALSETILAAEKTQQVHTADNNRKSSLKRKLREVAMNDVEPQETAAASTAYSLQPGDTLYMIRNGDNMDKVAHRFNMTKNALQVANNISNDTALQPGEKLIIPTHTTADVTANALPDTAASKHQIAPGETLYMVRKGDTVEKIANKYKISPSTLRLANLMGSSTVKEGDQIIIPTRV